MLIYKKQMEQEINTEKINTEETKREYRIKGNLKRFYTPREWFSVLSVIKNDKHKFLMEFLLHTGARINEARNVRVGDIDFEREQITLRVTKGRKNKGNTRVIQISTYLASRIKSYLSANNIDGKTDYLGFPSTAGMNKIIKKYTKMAGIEDWEDFSCHNLRKTLENWGVCLNVNHLSLQAHMGHTIDVAYAHYVANQLMTQEEKSLIKGIIDNLWCK